MKYSIIVKILKDNGLLIDCSNIEMNIKYLSYNSKDIKEDTLFFCKGFSFKRKYLEEAISNGIVCYISETDYQIDLPKIIVSDIRKALAIVSLNFYPDKLFKIGITGTKGKTTTNFYINNILKHHLGYKPGMLATQYFYDGKNEGETHLTTPESLELHKFFQEMDKNKLGYVTMEVASQAIKMNRVYGMHYDIGCFLNIGEDHISPIEHEDFADYMRCKIEFLKMCDKVVINKDTDYYDDIVEEIKDKEIITFGNDDSCDYYIKDVNILDDKIDFKIEHNGETKDYHITMMGSFNVINATCAIVVADLLGASQESILKGLDETKVEGRMDMICDDIGPVIVDFAHNKISADALFKSIKSTYGDRKIIAVFGSPGKRGISRKRDLGTSAAINADYIYLTEDDGGGFDVVDICKEIATFIEPYKTPYEIVPDRKTAIRKALSERKQGDVLVILGKGSEVYQAVSLGYAPYQGDMPIVEEYMKEVKSEGGNV